MKKIFKLCSILIISIIMFSLNSEIVKATTYTTTAEGSIEFVKPLYRMKMPYKTITVNGKTLEAYCSYYSKTQLGDNTFYKEVGLNSDEVISDREALGIATIIGLGTDKLTSCADVPNTKYCLYAVKEIAINLYLSFTKRNMDRFNFDWLSGYSLDELIDLLEHATPDDNPDNPDNNGVGVEKEKEIAKDVVKAYNEAKNATYVGDPYLKFKEPDEPGEFKKNGDKYEATFIVESNMKLNDNSFTVSAEGISSDKIIVNKPTLSNGGKIATIKVSIDESNISGTNAKVTVTAKTTAKKAKIRKFVNCDEDRCYQPYVTGEYDLEPITVSTDATVIKKQNTCYEYSMECDPVSCTAEVGQNNTQCRTKQTAVQTSGECDINKKQSGIKTADLIQGVCSLYCTESAQASLPTNVYNSISVKNNLVWPDKYGNYPLKTSSTLTCKIEMNNGGAVTQACINSAKNVSYNNGSAVAKLKYNDTKQDQTINLKATCNSSTTVNGASVTIKNNCQYELPEGKNIAVNKKTIEWIDKFQSTKNDVILRENGGVLPIEGIHWSYDLENIVLNNPYTLEILDLPLGYKGQFTSSLNNQNYTCEYNITGDISGGCKCPPGTKWSGIDLTEQLQKTPQTCAEAIELYCDKGPDPNKWYCYKPNGTKVDITTCLSSKTQAQCEDEAGCYDVCPDTSYRPGYKYEKDKSYKACLSVGNDHSTCMTQVCDCNTNCKFECPINKNNAGMDISACVYEQLKNSNNNLTIARQLCEKRYCEDSGETELGRIIYRTISLENPFPSKDADGGITGFNDDVNGRYPGTNWNSITLVNNRIRNNRGYDGSAIYNEAKPLYTINLDPTAIKKIREYNKKQINNGKGGYADFELNCTDGAYCISKFLHNSGITKADGSSILDISNSTCGNARNKSSFISCYTYK